MRFLDETNVLIITGARCVLISKVSSSVKAVNPSGASWCQLKCYSGDNDNIRSLL